MESLALTNFLVFLDLIVLTSVDLYLERLITATVAMTILIYGLVWESR